MKKLSIEEKAKFYDGAYKKVAIRFGSNVADEIFPELKESEDARIRKRIIALVNAHGQGMYKDEMLVWLEKQGQVKESPISQHENKTCKENGDSLTQEPVSEDLKEAAWLYYDKNRPPIPPEWDLHKEFIDFFKAGAQWQKNQTMKDAVDATVAHYYSTEKSKGRVIFCHDELSHLETGDMVKINVIKQEED